MIMAQCIVCKKYNATHNLGGRGCVCGDCCPQCCRWGFEGFPHPVTNEERKAKRAAFDAAALLHVMYHDKQGQE